MPTNQTTTDHAYVRLRDLEGTQRGFHFDSKGVLTLGSGFTPIIRNGGSWLVRTDFADKLTAAGINLSSGERATLQSVQNQMQKPGGLTAQERAAAEKALSGVKLSEAQNAALVRPQIEAAEKAVASRLGQKVYDSLGPKQQAELAVAAYQSPRAFVKAAPKIKAALMPSEKDGGRNELLFNSADQLTEAEALDLGRWYHGLQSSDPLRTELEKRRRDFYVLNYGNDPAPHDETGRMKPVQPIRQEPEKATPAKSADGNPLADGIRRIAGAVANRAGKDGLTNAAKVLQVGLNLAGQALKVDGDIGPKTEGAFASALADHGADKVTKRYSDDLGFGFG